MQKLLIIIAVVLVGMQNVWAQTTEKTLATAHTTLPTKQSNTPPQKEDRKEDRKEKTKEDKQAKKEKKQKKTSFVIMPIHNSVAGFSNVFLGNIELSKKVNFTFYSVFWNNPNFGNLNTGSDLFLETGVGLGFKLANNKLYINPTLGFGHGKFLSGGDQTTIGEGFIPSVLVLYNSKRFELDSYFALYQSLRKRSGNSRDLMLNWVVPGYKISKRFSLGAYYEQFAQTRTSDDSPEKNIYQWTGGYVKLSLDSGVWFRFAAGRNLATELGTGEEFYKIQAFIPLH
jgi:hypothetical protein